MRYVNLSSRILFCSGGIWMKWKWVLSVFLINNECVKERWQIWDSSLPFFLSWKTWRESSILAIFHVRLVVIPENPQPLQMGQSQQASWELAQNVMPTSIWWHHAFIAYLSFYDWSPCLWRVTWRKIEIKFAELNWYGAIWLCLGTRLSSSSVRTLNRLIITKWGGKTTHAPVNLTAESFRKLG